MLVDKDGQILEEAKLTIEMWKKAQSNVVMLICSVGQL